MAQSTGRDQGALRRLVNLGLLIGGFGLGQGTIFLAQTYLAATNRTELLAQFGTHFSFAMLGIIIVEAGSLTILSGEIARLAAGQDDRNDIWRVYWETTVFRLVMASALVAASLLAVLFLALDPFSEGFLAAVLPAFLVWSLNGAGFLDGLQKSGISGISGAIAYIAAAGGLLLSLDMEPGQAGIVIGSSISLGYAATVAVQFAALATQGFTPRFVKPHRRGLHKAFIEESSMLMGLLPGQLYFRAQLAISSLFLGSGATAILVYSKQIVGAASQISGFARRIEFPRMAQAVARQPGIGLSRLVMIQKISFLLSLAMACALIAASLLVTSLYDGFMERAWSFLAIFCVTILSEAVGQSMIQSMFARQLIHSAAIARLTAVAVATVASYVLVPWLGLHAFVASDLVSHAIVVSLSLLFYRSARPS